MLQGDAMVLAFDTIQRVKKANALTPASGSPQYTSAYTLPTPTA